MSKSLKAAFLALTMLAPAAPGFAADAKPTIVLVHGAFAASESWDGVNAILERDGYDVVAIANPLRGLAADSAYATRVVDAIDGPVVLVGHSYGGAVISNVDASVADIKALVYVAAFSPDKGESIVGISQQFPGGTLGEALAKPVALADGEQELSIDPSKFHGQFAGDVAPDRAALMAIAQRPVVASAFGAASGEPLWKTVPSYHIYGTGDKNITAAAMKFMAERSKARETVAVEGASHVVMVSQPEKVAAVIENAAAAQ